MLLVGVKEENDWLLSRWNLTYNTGWESICKAARSVYDFYKNLEILVDDRLIGVSDKDALLKLDEARSLTIRGLSTIIKAPVMITFYNQTNAVSVSVACVSDEFKQADYQKFNMSLCQYMDSIELAMHR